MIKNDFMEYEFIQIIKNYFPKYIGYDCAKIDIHNLNECNSDVNSNSKFISVISKDMLIQNVHFRKEYYTPQDLAHKALNVNISDIISMCSNPVGIMLGISFPNNEFDYMTKFINHFCELCKKHDIYILGGDTCYSQDIFISITIIGNSPKYPIQQKPCKGDLIYITDDKIGFSNIGLYILENQLENQLKSQMIQYNQFIEAAKMPNAKIKHSSIISSSMLSTCMTDVSDGLYLDLMKICKYNNKSACISISNYHINQLLNVCNALKLNPYESYLFGGEDYGLLFTIKKDSEMEMDDILNNNNLTFHKIGYITDNINEHVKDNIKIHFPDIKSQDEFDIKIKSFKHF